MDGRKAADASALIGLYPSFSSGFMQDRYDIAIRGRILAALPIEEATLVHDETTVGRILFSDATPATAVTLPDGGVGFERTFQFSLPLRADALEAPQYCVIVARTRDERLHAEAFVLAVDPHASPAARIMTGAIVPAADQPEGSRPAPAAVLYLEHAAVDRQGTLTLRGWAIGMSRVVAVQVFTDDSRLATAKYGNERPDVSARYPDYPESGRSGFSLTVPLPDPLAVAGSVRVQALCMSGVCCESVVPLAIGRPPEPVAASPGAPADPAGTMPSVDDGGAALPEGHPAPFLPAPPSLALAAPAATPREAPGGVLAPAHAGEPPLEAGVSGAPEARIAAPDAATPDANTPDLVVFCDSALVDCDSTLTVVGWAVGADGIERVTVSLDGARLGEAQIGRSRPDVSAQFPAIPMAGLSGFRFEQRLDDLDAGEHVIQVRAETGAQDSVDTERPLEDRRGDPSARVQPVAATDPGQEFRFELDNPALVNGAVADPVTGRLTIEGWVVARSGITSVEIDLDGQRLGTAHYGLARQDVGAALPDWDMSLRSGWAFHCPPRALKDGPHAVAITACARNGQRHIVRFEIEVRQGDEGDQVAAIRRRVGCVEARTMAGILADLGSRPRFRVVIRQMAFHQGAEMNLAPLLATLNLLRYQIYSHWEATVLADVSDIDGLAAMIAAWNEQNTHRVALTTAGTPGWDSPLCPGADWPYTDCPGADLPRADWPDADWPVAGHSGADHIGTGGVANQPGLLCSVLCAGDELGADALSEIALAAGLHPGADLIYADELRMNPARRERDPFFKPDWSPDLLLSTNYIGRPWFASAALLQRIAATPRSLTSDGEYDLLLRATESARAVLHVPKLLASRGQEEPDSPPSSVTALSRAAARHGVPSTVIPGWGPGTWRLRPTAPVTGTVSIIIPTCAARGLIETCIRTLRGRTSYGNIEIVCIDNIPAGRSAWKDWLQRNADRVLDVPEPFNWSRFNNLAAAATRGEYLLFLNDDVEIVHDDWLDALLEPLQRAPVAIAGPQLLYPDRSVQHAGMFLADEGLGRHAFRFSPHDEPGYFGLALTRRNVISVTGACMLVRRKVFDALGGFDERHNVVNNDLDFCLRAHRAGWLTVFTPYASLIHHELASRDKLQDSHDRSHFMACWRTRFAAGDPYFSPRLSRHSDDYQPDDEPLQTVYAGHPLFRPSEIRRILAMKLDHIGDFVTALPAIRRLKQAFPQADLTVLAAKASEAVVDLEPAIDKFIPFEFFHARSELGEREVTRTDLEALRESLAPYRFDLAVDLRKHLSTREVLRFTGARFLAGFDYMGQFPFLDIALEWDGDRTLQRKRSHIMDDLLGLVDAIVAAGTGQATPPPPAMDDGPGVWRAALAPLCGRRLVAVHAGAGNITKQWPAEHFAALIDLLIACDGAGIVLIGGPDDVAVSQAIIAQAARPEAIACLAGCMSLAGLPQLLAACDLFIGNDSGPKHIAAALDIPTIGIHSGVVDANEWAPVGRRAVAVQRNMTCSPCYLANAADCPRNLACLRRLEPTMVHHLAQMFLASPLRHASIIDSSPNGLFVGGDTGASEPSCGGRQEGRSHDSWRGAGVPSDTISDQGDAGFDADIIPPARRPSTRRRSPRGASVTA
jgi:O-antigen biosynthesis protein